MAYPEHTGGIIISHLTSGSSKEDLEDAVWEKAIWTTLQRLVRLQLRSGGVDHQSE